MSDPTETLARLLALYAQRNPDRKAYRYATQAERILADPGPLLATLTEAGVLREERQDGLPRRADGHSGHDPSLKAWFFGCPRCNPMPHDCETGTERRYVTDWEATDA